MSPTCLQMCDPLLETGKEIIGRNLPLLPLAFGWCSLQLGSFHSLKVLTINFPSACGAHRNIRIPLFGLKQHFCCKHKTVDAVFEVVLLVLETAVLGDDAFLQTWWSTFLSFGCWSEKWAQKSLPRCMLTQVRGRGLGINLSLYWSLPFVGCQDNFPSNPFCLCFPVTRAHRRLEDAERCLPATTAQWKSRLLLALCGDARQHEGCFSSCSVASALVHNRFGAKTAGPKPSLQPPVFSAGLYHQHVQAGLACRLMLLAMFSGCCKARCVAPPWQPRLASCTWNLQHTIKKQASHKTNWILWLKPWLERAAPLRQSWPLEQPSAATWVFGFYKQRKFLHPDNVFEDTIIQPVLCLSGMYDLLSNYTRSQSKDAAGRLALLLAALRDASEDPLWRMKPKVHLMLNLSDIYTAPLALGPIEMKNYGGSAARSMRSRGGTDTPKAAGANLSRSFAADMTLQLLLRSEKNRGSAVDRRSFKFSGAVPFFREFVFRHSCQIIKLLHNSETRSNLFVFGTCGILRQSSRDVAHIIHFHIHTTCLP